MAERKFTLNPYATPFVPVSNKLPGTSSGKENKAINHILGDSVNNDTAEYQLPERISVEYNIQEFEKLCFSDESSSKMAHHSNDSDSRSFQDETNRTEKQSLMEHPDLIILSSMFPNYSLESLADIFDANNGDLNETVNMLEQLEDEAFGFEELHEPLEISKNSHLTTQESTSSGTSGST